MFSGQRTRLRGVVILVFIGLGVLVVWLGIQYLLSFHEVQITVDSGSQAQQQTYELKKGSVGVDETTPSLDTIQSFNNSTTRKLRNGVYTIQSQKNDDFQPINTSFTVDSKHHSITIKPVYSQPKLSALLATEKNDIDSAVRSKNPSVYNFFDVQTRKLYDTGEWCGVILKYKGNNTTSSDSLRVVLHKVNGVWSLVTQPDLVISGVTYPGIPHDILVDLNKLD